MAAPAAFAAALAVVPVAAGVAGSGAGGGVAIGAGTGDLGKAQLGLLTAALNGGRRGSELAGVMCVVAMVATVIVVLAVMLAALEALPLAENLRRATTSKGAEDAPRRVPNSPRLPPIWHRIAQEEEVERDRTQRKE